MPTTDYSNYKLGRFLVIILVLCLLSLLIWPYIKAEYYTQKYEKQLDIVAICQSENTGLGVTGYKILNHSPESRTLEIYCFYTNSELNNYLKLEKQADSWKSIYSNRLVKDSYMYYPFYYY